ncbi:hypothetical protein GCM10022204_35470 [Microlunatus aurantiacus]|uniref:Uncharacterized protein n=1 Tax=Microlunatus aurantiacus TaxID=446786 RepID=A0ABP7E247_9ACTN
MIWVIVFGAIALGGLVMVVCFGVSLWRKSQALLDEVGGLLAQADQVLGLLDQVGAPGETGTGRSDRQSAAAGTEIHVATTDLSRRAAT